MKGVAVRLSYEEEAGDGTGDTPSQQIGQQIQQVNVSTPNAATPGQQGAIPHQASTPVMGIISRGPTQATSDNTLVPAHQGPIPTGPQLPMSQLLAAQNIPYLPYTPYYPWQNMGMGATPIYQVGPSVLSNPASHSARRGTSQPGNDRVILQAESPGGSPQKRRREALFTLKISA
ncbi:hypothetical protein L1987_57533 [Smallanthus sonchifolius]|uniref:Uncharacterized protein n=1 Tax=Smallanthus sonchifolius TaxID=185202 RepID=A0ACB9DD31_9ASTR|nr:hypothetical protein L1987_57533 [Smallanthus sonchifolius]